MPGPSLPPLRRHLGQPSRCHVLSPACTTLVASSLTRGLLLVDASSRSVRSGDERRQRLVRRLGSWRGLVGRWWPIEAVAARFALGASVYELAPGCWVPFHFHHGSEELLVVLRGRPTLRTAAGSRELAEGEAVHFPAGPEGVHGVSNETSELVRYLMASTLVSPEVAEYPDLRQITAQARTDHRRASACG